MKKNYNNRFFKFLILASFVLPSLSYSQVVNTESFDGTTFPPAGWQNTGSSYYWDRVTSGNNPSQSTHSGAGEASFEAFYANAGTMGVLYSPKISYVSLGSDTAFVSFWLYRDHGSNTATDRVEVYIDTVQDISNATFIGSAYRSRYLTPYQATDGWYQYTFAVPSSFNDSTNYLMFSAVSGFGKNIFMDDITWESFPPACIDPPNAGTAISLTNPACAGGLFNLSLDGNSSGLGQTYQWQSSPDSIVWTDIPGATNSFTSTSQTSDMYYRCNVTCGAGTVASDPVLVGTSKYACYCKAEIQSIYDNDIGNVTFGSINNGIATPATYNTNSTNTFTDFTSLPPAVVYQGQTLPISISQIWQYFNYDSWVNVFIDYNQDGSFDPITERVFNAQTTYGANTTVGGIVNVPVTATLGLTYMRVMTVEYGNSAQSPCGIIFSSGETEDYMVKIIAPPSSTPSCVAAIAPADLATDVFLSKSVLTWNTDSLADSYEVSFGTSSPPTVVDTVITPNYALPTLAANTTYYWQINPVNLNGSSSGCPIWSFNTGTQWNYCVSSAQYTYDNDIGNVTFGTLNNGNANPLTNNPNATNTYTNYTSLPATQVYQGQVTPISVSQIWPYNNYSSWVNVFIDYNQDGIFDPTTERVFNGSSTAASNPLIGTITIPAGAMLGTTTMRVMAVEYGTATDSPCMIYSYGETEDYTLNIVPPPTTPPSCVAGIAPLDMETNSFLNSSLSWAGEPIATSYDVYFGTSLPAALVGNQTATTYIPPVLSPNTTYYWQVVPKNSFGSSVGCSTWSFTTGSLFNYCTSGASQIYDNDIGNVTFGTLNNGVANPYTSNSSSTKKYSNYDTLPPTPVFQGQTVPISITEIWAYNNYGSAVSVFIDYDHDGVFDPITERVFSNYTYYNGTTISSGTVTIPVTATLGQTKMRVMTIEYGSTSALPCGNYYAGETEDYILDITVPPVVPPNCVLPTSPWDAATEVHLNASLNWSMDAIATDYQVYFGTSSTPPVVDTVSTTSYTPPAMSPNTTYYWQIVPMNSNGSALGCSVWSFTTGTQWDYCESYPVNYYDDDIGNVKFGSLNNGNASPIFNNATSINTYTDFTGLPATPIFAGQNVPVSVTQINQYNYYPCWVNVFIDFNQDGTFDPNTERIFNGPTSPSNTVVAGTANIPASALIGKTTMRVTLIENGTSSSSPCTTYNYGETEDYTVELVAPPTITPSCVNFIAPADAATDVIINSSISWTLDSIATGYIVYYGTTNPPVFADSVISNSYTPPGNTANTTYYWQIVPYNSVGTASGCTVWSFTTGTLWNYCTSYAQYPWYCDIGNVKFASLNNGNANPPLNNANSNKTYTNYTNVPAAQIFQGQTVPISISEIWQYQNWNPSWVNVFIDYDQDGVYDPITERVFDGQLNAYASTKATGSVLVPLTANIGKTGMRVIATEYGSSGQPPCGMYSNGETEDYVVDIAAPPTTPPLCINPIDPTDLATGVIRNSTLSWVAEPFATSYDVYFDQVNPPQFITNVTGTNYTPPIMDANTTYYWQVIPKNSNGDATGCSVWSFTTGTSFDYCLSSAQYKYDVDIGNVTIGTLNNGNASPTSNNPESTELYTNYMIDPTVTIPSLIAGADYLASVTNIWQYTPYIPSNWISIFIDYNQDGTLDPVAERAMTKQPSSANPLAAVTQMVTIPFTAVPGPALMRVMTNEYGTSTQSPCATYSQGETEDYLVTILPPPPIDMRPTAIIDPTPTGCYSSSQPVTVRIRNTGSDPMDFSATNTVVTVDVTGAATQTFTVVLSTNSLNGNVPLAFLDSLDVLVGNLDMSSLGTYVFNVSTSVPGDGNTLNDNLAETTRLVASGSVLAGSTTICNGSSSVLNLVGSNGTIQWQSFNGTTWINETGPGSTTSIYPASPTTAAVDYRALVCGILSSDTVSISVVTAVPPVMVGDTTCSGTVANLSGTGSGTLRWYTGPTGGVPIKKGGTYSPVVSTPTNYYVSASSNIVSNVGKLDTLGGGSQYPSGPALQWLIFDVFSDMNLDGVTVYPGAAGTVVIQVDSSFVVIKTASMTVTAADINKPTYMPLNFAMHPGVNYRISNGPGSVTLYRNNNGINNPIAFPFVIPGVLSIKSTTAVVTFPDVPTNYYYFCYNWQVTSECESARTLVTASIGGGAIVSAGNDTTICDNATITLDAGPGFNSYNWNSGAGSSQQFNVSDDGMYIVDVLDGSGCHGKDTVNVSTFPPVIVDLGNDTAICNTCTMTLDAGPGTDYEWQDGSPSETFIVPAGTTSMTYYVIVSQGACTGIDSIVISRNVGMDELNWTANNIKIQPNPSSGNFNINYKGAEEGRTTIEIRNIEGQLVYFQELEKLMSGFKKEINLSNYAKGVYSIKISSSDHLFIDKLIIQ